MGSIFIKKGEDIAQKYSFRHLEGPASVYIIDIKSLININIKACNKSVV